MSLTIESGALFLPRHYLLHDKSENSASIETSAAFLDVPLLLRFTGIPLVSVGAGVTQAFRLGDVSLTSTVNGVTTPSSTSSYTSTMSFWTASASFSYPIIPTLGLRIDGRYLRSMADFDNSVGSVNQLQLLAGVSFSF